MARKCYTGLDLLGLELLNLRLENVSSETNIQSLLDYNAGRGEGRILYDSNKHVIKYCGLGKIKTIVTSDDIEGMIIGLESGIKAPTPWQEEMRGLNSGTGYALTIKGDTLYILAEQADETFKAYAYWNDQVWSHSSDYYLRKGMCIVIEENIYKYNGTKWEIAYAGIPKDIPTRVEYLENINRRGTMEVWHTIIDYTKQFETRASGSTVVARFAVNPYNPKPQNQFIIPSYKVSDGVDVKMTICSDANCTNVIAEEGDMIEFEKGNFVYVKYDLYYHTPILGKKVEFAARDAYGDYTGDTIETSSPVILFCESDYVTPMNGVIKVHSLNGGMLTAAGKAFGSDYKFLSKLSMEGVISSGGGDISRVRVGKDFDIKVKASADNTGDKIEIQVETGKVAVVVSNETSPEFYEEKAALEAVKQRVSTIEEYFSTTADGDNVINKWKEVESFLKNIGESENLASILKNINDILDTKKDADQVAAIVESSIQGKADKSEVILAPTKAGNEGDVLTLATSDSSASITPQWKKHKIVENSHEDYGNSKIKNHEWFIDISAFNTWDVTVSIYRVGVNVYEMIIADVIIGNFEIDGKNTLCCKVVFGDEGNETFRAVIVA